MSMSVYVAAFELPVGRVRPLTHLPIPVESSN